MKWIFPLISGFTAIALAAVLVIGNINKDKKQFQESGQNFSTEMNEARVQSVSKKYLFTEDEIENIYEMRRQKDIIYTYLNDKNQGLISEKKVSLQNREIQNEDILEQIPAEKPQWVLNVPVDPQRQKIYFIGESLGQEKYESAYQEARVQSMVELCQYIKRTVDVTTEKLSITKTDEQESQLIKKISSVSKNTFMQESIVLSRYYLKLKANKQIPYPSYQLYVLVSYPIKNLEEAVKKSLAYEKEILKGSLTAQQLKIYEKAISEIKIEELEKTVMSKMEHDRALLYSHQKIENLYLKSFQAESYERQGKLMQAYREYQLILDKIEKLLK